MSDFFNEFKAVSKNEWEAQIVAELKGKDVSLLITFDPIEEIIELSKYSTIGRYPLDLEPVTENNYKHAV